MLDQIVPVILTYDEAPNLARSLEPLRWAREVIVIDSFSRDATPEIARSFPNVRLIQNAFESHVAQWNFGLAAVTDPTRWVLALDADYVLTPEFVAELAELRPSAEISGYRCNFRYCIAGKVLRSTLYPPGIVLFRRSAGAYIQDGHTQRLRLHEGRVAELRATILHDDRKPTSRWLASQKKYVRLEADKLGRTPVAKLSWPDRVRRVPFLAPALVPAYCLMRKGLVLDGVAGLHYTAQRSVAELLLSIEMTKRAANRLRRAVDG